jgi:transcriptional regulator
MTEPSEVQRLVREHPWATIVSSTERGLVASHYPFLLEKPQPDDPNAITLVSHVGRPDEQLHELGQHEVMVVFQGPHGYISPSWYPPEQFIPTWNHLSAHLYGVPEILSDDENFRVLGELVDHFEQLMPAPISLEIDEAAAKQVAKGTVGIRIRITRFNALAKLSQNKAAEVVTDVIAGLESEGPYQNEALAAEMRREHHR